MILKELEGDLSIEDIVDKHGISKATLYRWKKKVQKSENAEMKRLIQADEENSRLRSLLADAALETHALKEKLAQKE
ncbi:MAG: transposase [Sneathiella sp.]|nr:transposase [Sneathiella sp.]